MRDCAAYLRVLVFVALAKLILERAVGRSVDKLNLLSTQAELNPLF